jgi:8-oxo-dGTP diphosphatase
MSDNTRHTLVVGCLIRNGAGEILLVRHHKRGWEIPQGRVEEGEDIVAALHREVLEEAGVRIAPGPLAGVWSKVSPPAALVLMFLGTHLSGEPTPSDETPEIGWYAAEDALQMVTHPITHDRLVTLLNYTGTIAYRSYTTGPYRLLAEGTL